MGAVKTNRKQMHHSGREEKYTRQSWRAVRVFCAENIAWDCNNRRKMAGLPLIRRAKS